MAHFHPLADRSELTSDGFNRFGAALLGQALDASTILAVTDAHGVIVDCNQKFIDVSGYRRDELIGSTHSLINSGVHERSFFVDLYRTIGSGRIWKGTICNRRKDGALYWVDTTIVPSMGANGRPEAYLAVRLEVTGHVVALHDLAAANAAAEQAGALRDSFLANMSHEVRTPLNGILGLSAALLQSELSPSNTEKVQLIVKAGESLRRILDDVLDLTKVQAGALVLVDQPFRLIEEVAGAVGLMGSLAEQKGVALRLDVDPATPDCVMGDAARLRQVVLNLVSNAVKFTGAGQVRVSVAARGRSPERRLHVRVCDTGVGFDRAAGKRLFRPFTQLDASHAKAFAGTGLGLSISHELAVAMGGRIRVRSTPGKGSVFILTLPLRPAGAPEPVEVPEARYRFSDARRRVLLVEDNTINQRVVQALLEPFEIDLDIAENGLQATHAFAGGRYDVVLMDMQMPVMDGLEATRTIRALETESGADRTPVVMLTANASDAHRLQALGAGADDVVAKPFTPVELLGAVGMGLTAGR